MNFNSRETYLAYVAAWKESYKELTANSIKAKRAFKLAQREFSKAGVEGQHAHWAPVANARLACAEYKEEANALLAERAESKVEAARQMTALKTSS